MSQTAVTQPLAPARSKADQAERLFTLGIFAYSLLRVVPVWGAMEEGNVNPWAFLALDVGTAWPYAKSMARTVRSIAGRNIDGVLAWGTVLVGTFLAPYAYVYAVGENIPGYVWGVLGAFIALGAVLATRSIVTGVRAARLAA